jgi:hypothetical protein
VATRLKSSPKTIYDMCGSRQLRCHRAVRGVRVSVEEVERIGNEAQGQRAGPRFPDTIKRHC